MDARTILIFGAGINQLTLIQAARALGLISVVIDPNEDAPGRQYADYFYCIEGRDYAKTKEVAKRHGVSGIVTSQMETPLRLMARLAEELGLIFHAPEIAERSLDKWLMKQAFQQAGIPCAQGMLLSSGEEVLPQRLSSLGFPLIIKPKDAHSSRGVFKVDSAQALRLHLPQSRSYSPSGQVIAEEFLAGPEYSVETITYRGATTIIQITEKFVTPFPYTVELGHLQPAVLSADERAAIEALVSRAIQAIGIDNSASHTEVKRTAEGPKLIEIGARLGGDFISSYLTLASCGVDMDRAAIQLALGENPDLKKKWEKYACIKYFQLPAGKEVLHLNSWQHVLNAPEVVFAHINIHAGEAIPPITESKNRPGFVIVRGESREEVLARADKYAAMLAKCVRIKTKADRSTHPSLSKSLKHEKV
jgi:biotin carboxylase